MGRLSSFVALLNKNRCIWNCVALIGVWFENKADILFDSFIGWGAGFGWVPIFVSHDFRWIYECFPISVALMQRLVLGGGELMSPKLVCLPRRLG